MPAFFREQELECRAAFVQAWPKVKLRVARLRAEARRRGSRQGRAGSLVSRRVDSPPRRADSDFRNLDPQLTSVSASRRPPQGQAKLPVRATRPALALAREFQLDLPAPVFATLNREG
jgi:hypothetical protein